MPRPKKPFSAPTLAAVLAASALSHVCAGDIVFVNAAQPLPAIAQTGTSWGLAFKSLATALANAQPGDEVWVAQGVYLPSTNGTQTASFTPPDGIRVLGGFTAGDALESDRDPIANLTLLSGEIGAAGPADNSQHIIRANGVSGTEIDGFIITGGNADGSGADATGGAVLVEGAAGSTDILFRSCRFLANHSTSFGGAISIKTDGVTLTDCTFVSNSSTNGGAIDVQGGSVFAVNCRFLGNSANSAAAVNLAISNGSTIQNCIFSGNSASASAGALNAGSGGVVIETSTFANNAAGASGGALTFNPASTVHLRNSILWGNTANGNANQFSGSGSTFQKFSSDIQGIVADSQGNFSADPLFVRPLGFDNIAGTEDDDIRLRNASPCIDRGDSGLIVSDSGDADNDGDTRELLPIDLDGQPRLLDDLVPDEGQGTPTDLDLGAYEFRRSGTTLCVDASAPAGGDGSTWAKAFTSLQSAITMVNTQTLEEPVRIWVANGTYKPTTTTDRSVSFKLTKGVGMYGGFAGGEASLLDRFPQVNPTTLSGDIGVVGTTSDNSFHVLDIVASIGADTIIDGFVITGGNATGGSAPVSGGGVRVSTGPFGLVVLRSCRIHRNLGVTGAGVAVSGNNSLTLQNCSIAGNQATGGGGGVASTSTAASAYLTNCTVVGNTASVGGGVVAQSNGVVALDSSIIYFNTASGAAGEANQVAGVGGTVQSARNCCIQCLGVGSSIGTETNCIGANPGLSDPDGADGIFGTSDDVILLQNFSPCIDAGTNNGILPDFDDADEDGATAEPTPFDITLHGGRLIDDTAVPNGSSGVVDIGAVERQNPSFGSPPNPADLDGDLVVGPVDLAILLGAFGGDGPIGDVNFDCTIDASDLAVLLGAWTG